MQLRPSFWMSVSVAVLALVVLLPLRTAQAQMRLNDKDMEHIMKNLRDDAKDFRAAFDASIRKSAIRNTSREKDAKSQAEQFEKQTDEMYKHFKDSKKADRYVPPVIDSAGQLDRLVYSLNLDSKTTLSWEKARSDLHQIANSYGIGEPYFQSTTVR
jgi:glycyl-tRNA synthetase (class II)